VNVTLYAPRNNFAVTMMPIGKFNQGRNQQRLLLHQSEHKHPKLLQETAF
jgi:hypothetical protein